MFVDLFSGGETIDVNDLFKGWCGGVGVMRQLSLTMEPMMSRTRSTTSGAGTSQLAYLLAAGEQLHGGQWCVL